MRDADDRKNNGQFSMQTPVSKIWMTLAFFLSSSIYLIHIYHIRGQGQVQGKYY